MQIRPAIPEDVAAILAIHNEVVRNTTAIYEDEPSTLIERQSWFQTRTAQGYPVIVAVEAGEVLGYATFGEWRARVGYRFTVEHSVHVRDDQRGKGVGGQLLSALLPLARAMGKHVMIGAVDADNTGSIRFHERLGFKVTGRCEQVGYKFGRWLDVVWVQITLDTQ
ncbi:phosphinothricin acetyltransferase [Chitinivorax tropicus]|uniref:Phosphinothricin acetyltransferase n=1 Tax=Chitinivorax tropicus TaxID=714531 RepID=A0A840MKM4_9PROT|nr:GNAT family N-acetyltransferase [Chitinivorax tropicus]MBB5017262.1 phosphinothricin acetyltransferase [Chitinivorax tropicus]